VSDEFAFLPAGELVAGYASGAFSPVEVTRACLARIQRLDGDLGAFTHVAEDLAMDAARASEAAFAAGRPRGPLDGVPIALKELFATTDMPTAAGTRDRGAPASRDAHVVTKLRDGGAVLLGKLSMHELAFGLTSVNPHLPPCRNPWNRERVPGGSSGGSAVAVAAGFAPLALGTDTGGSIRIPAAFCGLVGFRPSWGAADMAGIAPLAPSADTVGPLAHSVADVALLFEVMTRPRPTTKAPQRRVGVLRQYFGGCPEIIASSEAALERLAAAGFEIEPVELPHALLPDSDVDIVDHEFTRAFDAYLRGNFIGGAPASVAALHASGAFLTDYDATLRRRSAYPADRRPYEALLERRAALRTAVLALLQRQGLDALSYPTSAVVPATLSNPASGLAVELSAWTGLPSLTLPIGQASSGIPIGIELLGYDNWQLLDAASEVEPVLRNAAA